MTTELFVFAVTRLPGMSSTYLVVVRVATKRALAVIPGGPRGGDWNTPFRTIRTLMNSNRGAWREEASAILARAGL